MSVTSQYAGGSPQSDRRSEYYAPSIAAQTTYTQAAQVPSLLKKAEPRPTLKAAPHLSGVSQRSLELVNQRVVFD